MSYRVPEDIRMADLTFAAAAEYFEAYHSLMDAVRCLPRQSLRDEALKIIHEDSIVCSTEESEHAFGWYHFRENCHLIALSGRECSKFETMEDTFRHESAHFLDALTRGSSNHDYIWREWATTMGAAPRATGRDEKFCAGILSEKAVRPVAFCEGCGQIFERQRRTDFSNHTHRQCGGGKLMNIFESEDERLRFSHYGRYTIL